MKKFIKYFVLFVLLFIPGIAFAEELEIVSVDVCSSDSGVLKVFQVIGYVIYIIKILVPTIIILLGMIEFGKATITKDEKAIFLAANSLMNKVIIGVLVFMVPTLLNALLNLVDGALETKNAYKACTVCALTPFSDECKPKGLMD